jgi:dolichol-phosphate mannosyltransferase
MPKPIASVIIPVWNEKQHIGMLLNHMPKGFEIIVVDDGSTDNTVQVVRTFGYEPLVLGANHGKGYACKAGAEQAKSDYLIFMDGDLQHDPRDLQHFAKELKRNDMVIGFRNFKATPLHRRFSNWLARVVINYITERHFHDVQCGFRAIKKSKFLELDLSNRGYEFELEMVIKAVKSGIKIKEIPISVSYHWVSSHGKKIKIGSRMHFFSSLKQLAYLFDCFIEHG